MHTHKKIKWKTQTWGGKNGGIMEIQFCRCGAIRQVNYNGEEREYGAWREWYENFFIGGG